MHSVRTCIVAGNRREFKLGDENKQILEGISASEVPFSIAILEIKVQPSSVLFTASADCIKSPPDVAILRIK